jgi:hypothetical protein
MAVSPDTGNRPLRWDVREQDLQQATADWKKGVL